MPESWRPSGNVEKSLSAAPWSADEAEDAAYAVGTGLNELSDFFSSRPAAVLALRDDSVEALLDASYAAANMPALQIAACDQARRALLLLLAPYLRRGTDAATCKKFSTLLDLAIYSHALLPPGDSRMPLMVALTNSAYHACGSLPAAMGYDYRRKLAAANISTGDVSPRAGLG